MLKNYIISAVRALGRQKLYSGLNIAGLSVGMALGILAILYVQYEYSYDDFHPGSNQIYRLTLKGKSSALKYPIEESSFALARELKES